MLPKVGESPPSFTIEEEPGVSVRLAIRFPVELQQAEGFDPERPATWPNVAGSLEFVGGRLLYMPPSGDVQQDVAMDVAYLLRSWSEQHREFIVGGNEAGLALGTDKRGADAAVFLRSSVGDYTGGFRRVPPVLAVEIQGVREDEQSLRDKARWYLSHGVRAVWLVLPAARSVIVATARGETRHGQGERLPPFADLPDLAPQVDQFFDQLEGR